MEDGLPWDDDIKFWWGKENGFKHSFEIYDGSGNYLNGVEPEREKISASTESNLIGMRRIRCQWN